MEEKLLVAILLFTALLTPLLFYVVHGRAQAREREYRLIRRLHGAVSGTGGRAERKPPAVLLAQAIAPMPILGRPLSEFLLHASRRSLVATLVLFAAGVLILGHWFHPLVALGAGLALGALPALYQRRLRARQLKMFSEQLPYLIDLLKSALEAGHTLVRALAMATQNLPDPISSEVRMMVEQVQLGMSMAEALEGMLRRVPVEELKFLIAAVTIQSEVGSSLAEILQHVSESVRARQRVEHQLRALTAQSRASAVIVALLPFLVLGVFTLINPQYAYPLLYHPLGVRLLQLAIGLDVAAFFVMRRLSQVEY
ncbi:MAG TPA: type II secretion system F family protein [Candidatus Binataceae bacterium]|jgi:tight adherence protein B|nr:type II secretion system F family protein [Candidatus Binataceae bacterium]